MNQYLHDYIEEREPVFANEVPLEMDDHIMVGMGMDLRNSMLVPSANPRYRETAVRNIIDEYVHAVANILMLYAPRGHLSVGVVQLIRKNSVKWTFSSRCVPL